MKENQNNVTSINLEILDIEFYKTIYQRILSLKMQNQKGGN